MARLSTAKSATGHNTWSRIEILLRLHRDGTVLRTAGNERELQQLVDNGWVQPQPGKARTFEIASQKARGSIQRRIKALWPGWEEEVAHAVAADRDPFQEASYTDRGWLDLLHLPAGGGQAAYRLLRQVVDEIERRHEGIAIGLKRNRDGTIQLDVRADPTLAKKLGSLEDEVLRLRRQVASAWARIREQNDEIEGLERRRDKLIASIATGGEPERPRRAAILFMDVEGFSALDPGEKARIVEILWGVAALRIRGEDVAVCNTWGDAVMAVFNDPNAALHCAFDFVKSLQAVSLRGRVGLSYGRVLLKYNPLRNRDDVVGRSVDEAARLEPLVKEAGDNAAVLVTAPFDDLPDLDRSSFRFFPIRLRLRKGVGGLRAGETIPCLRVEDGRNVP
ncbi:adenylate/guanylate cyclase domain-containing protein [Methylobacterium oryzisoli]|uniref:adenylate/guanylate cyclase domain-containing protein n=1 Tax=Methylobacterium oryzisoli TaxID=3385502 RepID=UPI003891F77C